MDLDLSSIMDKVKDILPILSYAINMIIKVLNLFGFFSEDPIVPEESSETSADL